MLLTISVMRLLFFPNCPDSFKSTQLDVHMSLVTPCGWRDILWLTDVKFQKPIRLFSVTFGKVQFATLETNGDITGV